MNRDELLRKLEQVRDRVSVVRQNAVTSGQPWFADQTTAIRAMINEIIQAQGKSLPSTKNKRIASKHATSSSSGGGVA
mgnify:CR=1 FL=1